MITAPPLKPRLRTGCTALRMNGILLFGREWDDTDRDLIAMGRRAPLLAASRVAVATEATEEQRVGAALLSRDQEYGPVLDLLLP
jgi:hypothetical protein